MIGVPQLRNPEFFHFQPMTFQVPVNTCDFNHLNWTYAFIRISDVTHVKSAGRGSAGYNLDSGDIGELRNSGAVERIPLEIYTSSNWVLILSNPVEASLEGGYWRPRLRIINGCTRMEPLRRRLYDYISLKLIYDRHWLISTCRYMYSVFRANWLNN
jgi:hypothetical protein